MNPPNNMADMVKQLRSAVINYLGESKSKLIENDETLIRFLKSRNWDLQAAEKFLIKDIKWRQDYRPEYADCIRCHNLPGAHSLRQIGFDECGRPVIYASFYEATTQRAVPNDAVAHLVYVIENAVRSMKSGITQWVFVMDCAGMTAASCHPRLGYECARVMSNHYPERLGLAICIRPGAAFKVAWKAIKPFLPASTVSKVCMIKTKNQLLPTLEQYFSTALCNWIMTEVMLNRTKGEAMRTRQFWIPPKLDSSDGHDPRGEKSYVNEWLSINHPTGHLPHPNIVDYLTGHLTSLASNSECVSTNGDLNLVGEFDSMADFEDNEEEEAQKLADSLPSEFQIPPDAEKLSGLE